MQLEDWLAKFHRIVGRLRPRIGVSENAWKLAQVRLGPRMATTALLFIIR
jgi:replication initiation protein RepC